MEKLDPLRASRLGIDLMVSGKIKDILGDSEFIDPTIVLLIQIDPKIAPFKENPLIYEILVSSIKTILKVWDILVFYLA